MTRKVRALGLLASVVLCAVGAKAQLAIVDNIPGVFVPIPDGTDLELGTNESAPITSTIGNDLFPPGTLWVGSNGGVGIGDVPDTSLPPTNGPLPSTEAFGGGRSALSYWTALWDDLDPGVRWKEEGDRLIIEWNRHASDQPGAGVITFQLQIFEDPGANPPVYAQFVYEDLDEQRSRAAPTIGYQVGDGVTAVEWTDPVTTGDVLTLVPEPASLLPMVLVIPWLRRR